MLCYVTVMFHVGVRCRAIL